MGNRLAASFPVLIDLLIRERHGSTIALGRDSKIGFTTVYRWRHGDVEQVTPATIRKLCASQGLSEDRVLAIIRRDQDLRRKGNPIPMPDLSDLRPGPMTKKERTKYEARQAGSRLRKVATALALVTTIAGSSGGLQADPHHGLSGSHDAAYQKSRRKAA